MYIKLHGIGGEDILFCAKEAIAIANKLDIMVVFNFNGISLNVFKNSHPEEIVDIYKREIKNETT